jgi:hypothetical protein
MAIHLTPTELGREVGMHRRQVIERCMRLGIPIFQGRIDRELFLAALAEEARGRGPGRYEATALPRGPWDLGLPDDVVVAVPAAGQRLYRLVNRDPPSVRDLTSRRDRDRPRFEDEPEVFYMGLSMFESIDKALDSARRYPKLVAEVTLPANRGFSIARTIRRRAGHYTVWGDASALVHLAAVVHREDGG